MSSFSFKQFVVHQERCAMKVSTDACIQGAWTPLPEGAGRLLDIGAGTGLLSLMMAQRFPGLQIDAVELDKAAAAQAADNIAASPWGHRIRLLQGDVRNMTPEYRYDMAICNPPFFTDHLTGPDARRNQARHAHTLDVQSLETTLRHVLTETGTVSLLLPVTEWERRAAYFRTQGWWLQHSLHIQSKEGKAPERVVSIWGQLPATPQEELLTVYEGQHRYTPEATALLKDFYLKL